MKKITALSGYLKIPSTKKIFRIMKLTSFFLLISVLSVFAGKTYSQSKMLSLTMEKASLKEVLAEIEEQSEFYFMYSGKVINVDREVSVAVNNQKIEHVLNSLFAGTDVTYTIKDRIIVLSTSGDENGEMFSRMQQFAVTGKVVDEKGIPLPGVTIVKKGTTKGTVTDADGNYSLMDVATNDILLFSFVGMTPQEVIVGTQNEINIVLQSSSIGIEEIIAVGYGTVSKRDITGAVSSMGKEELVAVGSTSPVQALQAHTAGVNISQKTGSVGSDFDVQIRGANSLTGGAPLYVVDGVMTDNINFLNTNDIKRIDILKDASSTAIYGSRGSNGVVIVSTQSAEGLKNMKPSITYSGFVGVRNTANMPDFLNSYDESILWQKDRQVARDLVQGKTIVNSLTYGFPTIIDENGVDYWADAFTNRNGTDWLDEFLKPSIQQNHFISASGGTKDISYVVGFGYQGDNGNAEGQYYNKYNFKTSVDAKISEKFSVGSNINLAYSNQELVSKQGYTQQLFRMPSYAPSHDKDGNVIQTPMLGISGNVSPYTFLDDNSNWNVDQFHVISNFYLKFSPIENLSFKSTFSPNAKFERQGEYKDRFATKSISVARMWHNNRLSYVWDNQVNFNKDWGAHSLSYDLIQSAQLDRLEMAYAYGRNVPFKSLWYNTQSAPDNYSSTGYEKSSLLSFTNRFNYSYADKYLVTATMRWDGSSKLAEGNKWAAFPSAAIAWRMKEETFLQNVSQIDNLKVRLSFGYTGNNNISPYTTQSALNTQRYYDWDGTSADGFIPGALSNSKLTWERTREWNLGADFGLFGNRVSGELNVYDRLSLDLIMPRKLAMPTGWAVMMDNVGSVSNKGLEITLRTINVKTEDFSWETNFVFSKNTNKIVELYGEKEDDVPNRWFIGQPVNVIYAMVFDGVWQKDELAPEDLQALEGTAKVKDLNNDGKIDIDNDMTVLGSPDPDWIGTFSTTLRYKNWDLSASVYTKQGVLQYSPFHTEFTDFNSKVILDVPYYVRENPVTQARYSNTYPQASYQGEYWGEDAEDYGYPGFNKDASFVRVQNITLGYNFSENILSKIGLAGVRLYVNALNPFTFTKYEGFDPEWAGASMSGIDANNTSYSIYQIGANIKF